MERDELRKLVIEILRANPQTHLNAVIGEIRRRHPDFRGYDALLVQEIIWELLLQGVLAPGKNSLNLNLPFIHLTEYGERALAEETLLHDPAGYIQKLEARIGRALPPVVSAYLRESLHSFLAGRDFAAAVLLGIAAAECLRALADRIPGELPTDVTGIAHRFVLLGFPQTEADSLAVAVSGLRRIAGYTRDHAGRPAAREVTRETAHAHLLLFFDHCAQLYAALDRLAGN